MDPSSHGQVSGITDIAVMSGLQIATTERVLPPKEALWQSRGR